MVTDTTIIQYDVITSIAEKGQKRGQMARMPHRDLGQKNTATRNCESGGHLRYNRLGKPVEAMGSEKRDL